MAENWAVPNVRRRDFLKSGLVGAALISSGDLLAACGGSSTSAAGLIPTSTGPAGGTPVKGGVLRVGVVSAGSAEQLDVRKAVNFADYIRLFNLLDPLFFQGPGGVMSPGLATEAHPNKDYSVWTLKLRDGVRWHDGKPFTADDVIFTLRASWHSKSSSIYALTNSLIDFPRLRKIDKLTVEIALLRKLAQFPQLCFTQNSHVVQNGTTNFNKVVGTGPFKLVSFTPGTGSVFSANRDYWQSPEPYVDTLMINSSFPTDTPRLNALLAGDIDIAPTVPPALAKAQASTKRIVLGNEHGPAFIAVTMGVDDGAFKDVRVRQALKLIPNREAIVSDAFDGFAVPGNDCPGNTLQYWASDLKPAHDPAKAKALLKAAGQESLAVKLYTSAVIPGQNETAALYAEQAKAAGVNVSVVRDDPATYYSTGSPGGTYPSKSFSINNWVIGNGSMPLFYLSALYKDAPFNETHWNNPSADKLLFDALGEGDPSAAQQKWHAVQKLQFDEGGYIVTSAFNWVDGYAPKVRGIKTTSAGACNFWDFKSAWFAA